MSADLKLKLAQLRQRALDLNKWIEFKRTGIFSLLITDYEKQLGEIRKAYGCVNMSQQGSTLAIAQLQGREQEKVDMLAFLSGIEKGKISLDEEIKLCESRLKQLNSESTRRSESIIQPEEGEAA